MAEEGSLKPRAVIAVLRKVLGEQRVKVDGKKVTVITEDDPRAYVLGDFVTRRTVAHISNRHGVEMHLFHHPEMVHTAKKGKAN